MHEELYLLIYYEVCLLLIQFISICAGDWLKMRCAIITTVYRKALTVSSVTQSKFSTGRSSTLWAQTQIALSTSVPAFMLSGVFHSRLQCLFISSTIRYGLNFTVCCVCMCIHALFVWVCMCVNVCMHAHLQENVCVLIYMCVCV